MRWRFAVPGLPRGLNNARWSVDGEKWLPMPGFTSVELMRDGTLDLTVPGVSRVATLLRNHQVEPLGHELFLESYHLKNSNRRSSVVVGVSALEVGLKQLISSAIPDSTWLLDNLPSPPVEKLLGEYLPMIPLPNAPAQLPREIPKRLRDMAKKAVTVRNQIAHRGAAAPEGESVREILDAVQDLLWLFDAYSGHHWAVRHLSVQTRIDLGLGYDPDIPWANEL
jgi:hypothetical protein